MKKVKIIEDAKIAEGCDTTHTLVKGEVMEFSDAIADRIIELEFGKPVEKTETKKADPVTEKKVIDPVSEDKNSKSGDSKKTKPKKAK